MNRFGHQRVPGCTCEHNFTCRACLTETGNRATAAQFGVFAEPAAKGGNPVPMITFTYEGFGDDSEDLRIELPGRYEVCHRCQGTGTHVNPSIDGNGLSRNDPDLDEDFWDDYFTGTYDVTCQECRGNRVQLVPDIISCSPEQLDAWYEHQREQAEYEAERRAEMRWGY